MPETEADGYTKGQMGEHTATNERGHTRSATEREQILTTARRRDTHKSLRQSQGKKRTKKNDDTNKAPEQQKEHKEQLEEEKERPMGKLHRDQPTRLLLQHQQQRETALTQLPVKKKQGPDRLQVPIPRKNKHPNDREDKEMTKNMDH